MGPVTQEMSCNVGWLHRLVWSNGLNAIPVCQFLSTPSGKVRAASKEDEGGMNFVHIRVMKPGASNSLGH